MKGRATGIIRRVDSLGRIVIPMEIRRTMRLKEGEPMEIFTGGEGELIFRKYSPIEEMGAAAADYAKVMSHTLNCLVCICDQDQIIAASGYRQGDYYGKTISEELEKLMETRKISKEGSRVKIAKDEPDLPEMMEQVVCPVISSGDVIGAVIIRSGKDGHVGEAERKQAQTAAGYLGSQMEN